MVFLVIGVQKTLQKRKNIQKKNIENEQKEKRRIQEKSKAINIFGFTFYIKSYILLENIV